MILQVGAVKIAKRYTPGAAAGQKNAGGMLILQGFAEVERAFFSLAC
jgi:hypothetical protein